VDIALREQLLFKYESLLRLELINALYVKKMLKNVHGGGGVDFIGRGSLTSL
jgi:hypothetical protein